METPETRREMKCGGCGRVFVITYRHALAPAGKRRELPLACPYEDCGRTAVESFEGGARLDSLRVRQGDDSVSPSPGPIR